MPRKTKLRRHASGWNPEHIRILKDGHDYFGEFRDEIDMALAWQELRADIMREWLKDQPGSRPFAWWKFNMPKGSRRERTDGGRHPHDRPGGDKKRELYFGTPRRITAMDLQAEYETEAQFLKRHDLLTAAERKFLKLEN